MPKCFHITSAVNSPLTLDSQGRASCQITVKNVTGAACDGRAVPVSLPTTNPPSGAVQNGWVKIDGPTEQRFERDQEKVFVLKFEVSPKDKDKAKPGKYQVAVDFVLVQTPDVGDRSQAFAFTVPETAKKEPISVFVWLIPVLVLVLIGVGVGVWLALRPSGIEVPDLHGKTLGEADTALEEKGLIRDENVQTAEGKPQEAGKIISQNPDQGKRVPKGGKVQVTLGAEKLVRVTHLSGQTLEQAIVTLDALGLSVAPSFTGDTSKPVSSTSPGEGAMVKPGSKVTLSFPMDTCAPNCIVIGFAASKVLRDHRLLAREKGLKPQ